MDDDILMFWHAGPQVQLSSAEIYRELTWGEEVEGLVDLPVREIIDRLKAAFPRHEEQSGLFIGHTGCGSFEATWTWQYFKVACRELDEEERELLIKTVGYRAYDPQEAGAQE